jgi:hypothetical protein
LYGICTDGASNMTGEMTGLIEKIREMNPNVKHSHCAIHKEVLASKFLPQPFKEVFDVNIQILNFIRARSRNHRIFKKICEELEAEFPDLKLHTEVRWLSKGQSFYRIFMLKDSILAFGHSYDFTKKEIDAGKHTLFEKFQDPEFQIILAYLCDIFEKLNKLNQTLQGKDFQNFL